MRDNSLSRLIKLASTSPTGDPGTDAMAAAAEAAKGPAGMPLLKMPKPGEKGGDESKDALRMAHELDSKNKEINGLRQQLQESKMEAMRTQLKADIASEQTKMREGLKQEQDRMRESLHQEQQKMRENLRNEQIKVQDQIRKEQKELDKQQAKIQLEEAQQKGNITAAEAQYQAQFTQAAAEQKAQMAIEQAQHKAQLDSDTAAHDVEIAQHKADSLLDIATQTTDLYNKQMDKARAGADQYFSGQQKQYAATHPVISPALQNRLDGAMQSVGRLGKALNDFTKQSTALQDLASQGWPSPGEEVSPMAQYAREAAEKKKFERAVDLTMRKAVFFWTYNQPEMAKLWESSSPETQQALVDQFNANYPLYKEKFEEGMLNTLTGFNAAQEKYRKTFGASIAKKPQDGYKTAYGTTYAQEKDIVRNLLESLAIQDVMNNGDVLTTFATSPTENQIKFYQEGGGRAGILGDIIKNRAGSLLSQALPGGWDPNDQYGGTATLQDRAFSSAKMLYILSKLDASAKSGDPYAAGTAKIVRDRLEAMNAINRKYYEYIASIRDGENIPNWATNKREMMRDADAQLREYEDVISGAYYDPKLGHHRYWRTDMFEEGIAYDYGKMVSGYVNPEYADHSVFAPVVNIASRKAMFDHDKNKSWLENIGSSFNPFPGMDRATARIQLMQNLYVNHGYSAPPVTQWSSLDPIKYVDSPYEEYLSRMPDDRDYLVNRSNELYGSGSTLGNVAGQFGDGAEKATNIVFTAMLPGATWGLAKAVGLGAKYLIRNAATKGIGQAAAQFFARPGTMVGGDFIRGGKMILDPAWKETQELFRIGAGPNTWITPGRALLKYPMSILGQNAWRAASPLMTAWWVHDEYNKARWNSRTFNQNGSILNDDGTFKNNVMRGTLYPLYQAPDPTSEEGIYTTQANENNDPVDNSSWSRGKHPTARPATAPFGMYKSSGYVDDAAEIQVRQWEQAAKNPAISPAMREQLLLRIKRARENIVRRAAPDSVLLAGREGKISRAIMRKYLPEVMKQYPNLPETQAKFYILRNYRKYRDRLVSHLTTKVVGGSDKLIQIAKKLHAKGVTSGEIQQAADLIYNQGGYSPDRRPVSIETGEEVPMSRAESALRFAQTGHGTSFEGEKNYVNQVLEYVADNLPDDAIERIVANPEVFTKLYWRHLRPEAITNRRAIEAGNVIKRTIKGYDPRDEQYGGRIPLQDRALDVAALHDAIYQYRERSKRGDVNAGEKADMLERFMRNFADQSAREYDRVYELAYGGAAKTEEERQNAIDLLNEYKDVTTSVIPIGNIDVPINPMVVGLVPYALLGKKVRINGTDGSKYEYDDPFGLEGNGIRITPFNPELEGFSSRSAVSNRAYMKQLLDDDIDNRTWRRYASDWFDFYRPLVQGHARRKQLERFYRDRHRQVPGLDNGDIFGIRDGSTPEEINKLEHPYRYMEDPEQLAKQVLRNEHDFRRAKALYGHGDSTGNWWDTWWNTTHRMVNATDFYCMPALGIKSLSLASKGLPALTRLLYREGIPNTLRMGGTKLTELASTPFRTLGHAAKEGAEWWPVAYYYRTYNDDGRTFGKGKRLIGGVFDNSLVNPTVTSWLAPTNDRNREDMTETEAIINTFKDEANDFGLDPDNAKITIQPLPEKEHTI